MKLTCPKCGRHPAGVLTTKIGKSRTLYSVFHQEKDGSITECKIAVFRKPKPNS